jgi:hypothetical protein
MFLGRPGSDGVTYRVQVVASKTRAERCTVPPASVNEPGVAARLLIEGAGSAPTRTTTERLEVDEEELAFKVNRYVATLEVRSAGRLSLCRRSAQSSATGKPRSFGDMLRTHRVAPVTFAEMVTVPPVECNDDGEAVKERTVGFAFADVLNCEVARSAADTGAAVIADSSAIDTVRHSAIGIRLMVLDTPLICTSPPPQSDAEYIEFSDLTNEWFARLLGFSYIGIERHRNRWVRNCHAARSLP